MTALHWLASDTHAGSVPIVAAVVAFVLLFLLFARDEQRKDAAARIDLAPLYRDEAGHAAWYDDSYRKSGDALVASDHNEDAAQWDDPATHRALLLQMEDEYDGWAIATAHDGLPVYGELPRCARIMIWHRPNGGAGAARLRNCWEPVIVRLPESRLSSRLMGGQLPDLLTCPSPRVGFAGAKPPQWTRWVLDALGYDPETDTVHDLFPGSGMVANAIAQGVLA